jgi:Ca2+-binding RTX toxin-like protein
MALTPITGTDGPDYLRGNFESELIEGLLGDDGIEAGLGDDLIIAGPEVPVPGYSDNDIAYGDTKAGENSNDTIYGGYGDDRLYGDSLEGGGGGNDILFGQAGNDYLNGGDRIDYLYGGNDNDRIYGGSGNDFLYGEAGDDSLYGEAGDDTLDGGTSADKMLGGKDNDLYIVDNAGDVVTENAAEGIDKVESTVSFTLGANVEDLLLKGTAAIDGTGNNAHNAIVGNDANNSLYGLGDSDYLSGAGGNDFLDGGDGDDQIYGGAGDDQIYGRAGADQMYGGIGNDLYLVDNVADVVTERAAEGTDTVVTSTVSYTLGANVENLTLSDSANLNGTGNDLDNYILGNAGSNVIDGKGGNDLINGRDGNDAIIGGAGNDTLLGGLGADKFRFSYQSEGIDIIKDFNRSEGDKIEIVKSSFGANSLNQFSYNSSNGDLFFDASSSDNVGAVQLATIQNKPAGFSVQDIVLA